MSLQSDAIRSLLEVYLFHNHEESIDFELFQNLFRTLTSTQSDIRITRSSFNLARDVIMLASTTIGIQCMDTVPGGTLLHHICRKKAPLSVVEMLVDLCPESVTIPDHNECCPLHYAAEEGSGANVVEYLIRADASDHSEDSLSMQDKDGNAPVGTAAFDAFERNAITENLRVLIDRTARVSMCIDKPAPLLHSAICCAHQFYTEDAIKLIQMIIKEHPEQVRQVHKDFKHLPLHIASDGDISVFLAADGSEYDDVDEEFSKVAPIVYQDEDDDNDDDDDSNEEEEGNRLDTQEDEGCLYMRPDHVIKSMLEMLVAAYPEGARQPDSGGEFPLHFATHSGLKWEAVKVIWEAYPAAVKIPNPEEGGLYPFMLAASSRNPDLTTIYMMMREFPELLRPRGVGYEEHGGGLDRCMRRRSKRIRTK